MAGEIVHTVSGDYLEFYKSHMDEIERDEMKDEEEFVRRQIRNSICPWIALSAPSFKANWIFWSTNLPAGFLKITCVMWNGCRQIC